MRERREGRRDEKRRGAEKDVQIVYWLVESLSSSKDYERGREVVNGVVEIFGQTQGSQAEGKVIQGVGIVAGFQIKAGEGGREVIKWFFESASQFEF